MSDLVAIEDLGLLDAKDLRAVLGQVPEPQLLEALAGVSAGLRRLLLTRLSAAQATQLEARVNSHGPVTFEAVQAAQRTVVETLCRLSRGGQVAFDDPEDMVA
ncbi:MAG TPA: FliG C-terminal domain-containing protein [Isosphaeraceae bacterium]